MNGLPFVICVELFSETVYVIHEFDYCDLEDNKNIMCSRVFEWIHIIVLFIYEF